MRTRHQAAVVGVLAILSICAGAAEPSLESARSAREKAKADLIKAQEGFDRADEAYIKALGGAVPGAALATRAQTAAGSRSQVVTFSLSGPRAQIANPLAYRARVITDGQPGAWTQHASGAKIAVPAEAHVLAYEVQTDERDDVRNPAWRTICAGSLGPKDSTLVDIEIARETRCTLR